VLVGKVNERLLVQHVEILEDWMSLPNFHLLALKQIDVSPLPPWDNRESRFLLFMFLQQLSRSCRGNPVHVTKARNFNESLLRIRVDILGFEIPDGDRVYRRRSMRQQVL
jgi:hypothetical protein